MKITNETENLNNNVLAFDQYPLKSELLEVIREMGFTHPTSIQSLTLGTILEGKDVVGQAKTGSGKTLAFVLPLLQKLNESSRKLGLIMVPTRELAMQVNDEIQKLGKKMRVKTALLTGGKAYGPQIQDLKRAHIIVATPGRLKDFMLENKLGADFAPEYIVLDEADRMLDMGFIDDIREIFEHLPENRQTILFSATFPLAVERIILPFMKTPVILKIKQETKTNTDVSLSYSVIRNENERIQAVVRLLDTTEYQKAIVFVQTKKGVDELSWTLKQYHIENVLLHGDTSQSEREINIRYFKESKQAVLVATDLAARGLDIAHVDLVINFHLPYDGDTFVHRIGRTGRAGKKGSARTLILPGEFGTLRRVEQFIKTKIEFSKLPTHSDVEQQFFKKFEAEVNAIEINEESRATHALESFLKEQSAEELLKKLFTLHYKNLELLGANLIGYQTPPNNYPSSNSSSNSGNGRYGTGPRRSGGGYRRGHSGSAPSARPTANITPKFEYKRSYR